jgi:hypothetical protein
MTLRSKDVSMDELLTLTIEEGASDLHLTTGVPPIMRINGSLHALDTEHLTGEDTDRLMRSIVDDQQLRSLAEDGGCDFGFGFKDRARFRVSLYKQKGNVGLALRQIPSKLLTGDRPHRLRQVDHARLDGEHHQRGARLPYHHDRGPDRVLPLAQKEHRHPARAARGRGVLQRRPARRAAHGPGRDSRR